MFECEASVRKKELISGLTHSFPLTRLVNTSDPTGRD